METANLALNLELETSWRRGYASRSSSLYTLDVETAFPTLGSPLERTRNPMESHAHDWGGWMLWKSGTSAGAGAGMGAGTSAGEGARDEDEDDKEGDEDDKEGDEDEYNADGWPCVVCSPRTSATSLVIECSIKDHVEYEQTDFEDGEGASPETSWPFPFSHVREMEGNTMAENLLLRLNTQELRRDPWNMAPHLEMLFNEVEGNADCLRLRDWDDPPPTSRYEQLDFVQQLLQGIVFFHEHGLTNIPFSEDTIIMDTGIVNSDLPIDRAMFPVKYYLASLNGMTPVDGVDDDAADFYSRDMQCLGGLFERIFSPDDSDEVLYPLVSSLISSSPPSAITAMETLSTAMFELESALTM